MSGTSRDRHAPELWESKWIASEARANARYSAGITFHSYPKAAIGADACALKALSSNWEACHTISTYAALSTYIRVTKRAIRDNARGVRQQAGVAGAKDGLPSIDRERPVSDRSFLIDKGSSIRPGSGRSPGCPDIEQCSISISADRRRGAGFGLAPWQISCSVDAGVRQARGARNPRVLSPIL